MKQISREDYYEEQILKFKKLDCEIKEKFASNSSLEKLYYEFEKQEDAIMAGHLYLKIINSKNIMEMYNKYGLSNDKVDEYLLFFTKEYILKLNRDFHNKIGILENGSRWSIIYFDDIMYCSIGSIETSKRTTKELISAYINNDKNSINTHIQQIVTNSRDIKNNIGE